MAFTSAGDGAAAVFCFCGFGWDDASALAKFGAGGPTISKGFEERVATGLMSLGAGVGAAFTRSGEGEAATFTSFGEGCGFTIAVEDKGDPVPGDAFGRTTLVGLGFPADGFRPLLGPAPE
ncbi:MAG TPA: hypothetical protein VHS80_06190 [Chthoniobacterales bacterium]|nr:hypothetical protein [Chthoniobacterales bacterium]